MKRSLFSMLLSVFLFRSGDICNQIVKFSEV